MHATPTTSDVSATTMLTPNDICNASFSYNLFASGYDADEVDEFLDACQYTLSVLEHEHSKLGLPEPPERTLAPRAVANITFCSRGNWYNAKQVDLFLDEVQQSILDYVMPVMRATRHV